jgi:hypothetical protein
MGGRWTRTVAVALGLAMAGATVLGGTAAAGMMHGFKICCGGGGGQDYRVTFTESGLPSGTNWSVTLNGQRMYGTTSSLFLYEFNGSYQYTVGAPPGYTPRPQGGLTIVNGAAVTVPITFFTAYFEVTFKETGLASGTPWWVSLDNGSQSESTGDTLMLPATNGTHTYQVYSAQNYPTEYTSSPRSGSFTVTGAPYTVSTIKFTQLDWTVKITESGLAQHTQWQAYLNNSSASLFLVSTNTTIVFTGIYNGTYTWYVFPVSGYTGGNLGSQVTVSGAQAKLNVNFS